MFENYSRFIVRYTRKSAARATASPGQGSMNFSAQGKSRSKFSSLAATLSDHLSFHTIRISPRSESASIIAKTKTHIRYIVTECIIKSFSPNVEHLPGTTKGFDFPIEKARY